MQSLYFAFWMHSQAASKRTCVRFMSYCFCSRAHRSFLTTTEGWWQNLFCMFKIFSWLRRTTTKTKTSLWELMLHPQYAKLWHSCQYNRECKIKYSRDFVCFWYFQCLDHMVIYLKKIACFGFFLCLQDPRPYIILFYVPVKVFIFVFLFQLYHIVLRLCSSLWGWSPYHWSPRGVCLRVCTVTLSHHNKSAPILFAVCHSAACAVSHSFTRSIHLDM